MLRNGSTMTEHNIKDLDELIYEYTGKNKQILTKKITNLTKPGENYFSLMLKIDVTLKNLENDEEENLNIVAKCRNKTGGFVDQFAPLQFKQEIGFYSEIVPALETLQLEQGLEEPYDIFPKLYASRRNLKGNDDEIDEHTVILMENLIVQGYSNIDRQVGFDLEETKHILKDIAIFHALPVALKLLKPDVFEASVKKYTARKFKVDNMPKMEYKKQAWLTALELVEETKAYAEIIENNTKKSLERGIFFEEPSIEPFASIIHNDLWVNNTMQIMENGKIVKNKLIDFQVFRYGNPFSDVIFFLFSSVQQEVLKENANNLIAFYQDQFFKVLESLKCDTSIFQVNFSELVQKAAESQLNHLLYMTVPIFGKKDESAVDFTDNIMDMLKESSITEVARNRLVFIVTEFAKQGWIQEQE